VLGEPLTIASDVYSLGVILYELLCDQRPYKAAASFRAARSKTPSSRRIPRRERAGRRRRRPALRGDLDTVVLKALKKNPGDRYPTVHALLDDIERHLSRRPVPRTRQPLVPRRQNSSRATKLALSAAAAVALALIVEPRRHLAGADRRCGKAAPRKYRHSSLGVQRSRSMMQTKQALSAVHCCCKPNGDAAGADYRRRLEVEMLAIIRRKPVRPEETRRRARHRGGAALGAMSPTMTARLHLALSQAREMTGDIDVARA